MCCVAVGLSLSFVFPFSCPSFLFRGMPIDVRLYGSCRFLWLQFFFPALLVTLFLCTSSLQCNSFWPFSCSWLALHFQSGLYPYRISSVVDASLLEQKTRAPYLLSSTHWLRMERLRCSRRIALRLFVCRA